MLATHFSGQPWIFNADETFTGLAALAGAVGFYQFSTDIFYSAC
jgi:hypothetical protein